MAKNKISNEDRFTDLDEDIQKYFINIVETRAALPYKLDFVFIQDYKAKDYVTIKKLTGINKYLNNAELAVIINERYHDLLDEEAKEILIEQAACTISVNLDTGKIQLIKPDLVTFSGIVKKYGLEKVTRANNLIQLIEDDQKDQPEATVVSSEEVEFLK